MSYSVGLKTESGFLTVEDFGGQMSAKGKSFLRKQTLTLESKDGKKWHLKSHKGLYLSSDHREVKADAESPGKDETYTLEYNNGLALFKNNSKKYLAAGNGNVIVDGKGPNAEWEIVYNIFPQICLTANSKFLADIEGTITSTKKNQFGRETLFTMLPGPVRGTYCFKTHTNNFVTVNSGVLKADSANSDSNITHFNIQFVVGPSIAVRSVSSGKFVALAGQGAKANKGSPSKKEAFELVLCQPQVTLRAANNKLVSVQGANVMCNRETVDLDDGDYEVFMLHDHGGSYSIMTPDEVYFSGAATGALTVGAKEVTDMEKFEIEYNDAGKAAFKCVGSGKYLTAKALGGVDNKGASVGDNELFDIFLENRPSMILQTSFNGFVHSNEGKISCNAQQGESFTLEFKDTAYAIKTSAGEYFSVGGEGKIVPGGQEWFYFELVGDKLAIKTKNGKYLKADSNSGYLVATADSPGKTELFQF